MQFSRIHFLIFRAASTLLVGTLADGAGAADFPVSTVAQINTALSNAVPGDTITMTNKVWTDADILFKKNGTATNPITLRAQTPGQVILNGTSRLRIAGNWLVADGLRFQSGYAPNGAEVIAFRESSSLLATNCALINCAIIDYSSNKTNDNKWVSVYGRSNRVENCYFAGKTNSGTTLVVWLPATNATYANYHVIRRNHFGLRPALGVNGGETIRVGTSTESLTSSRTLVEENLFRFCNGEIEIISNKSCDNLYRHNTFDSCEGALTLRHGNRCTVEGNWFFGRGLPLTGGVRIIGEDHTVFNNYFDKLTGSDARAALSMMDGIVDSPLSGYFQVKRAKVLFNTFVNCTNNFAIGVVGTNTTLSPIDSTNANNIVRGLTAPLVKIVTTPTNFLWQGNYFSGATVGTNNAGIITNNPLMVLSSDGLWRPATNSPVLGAAAGSYTFVTNDFDGQSRSGAKDVGCDQAATSPRTCGPLGPMDVGPDWMRIILSGGPSNQTAHVGGNASFAVVTDGTPPFSYRWQKGGTNLVNGGNISGATTNILTLTGVALSDVADYRVIVTNTYGSVTSAVATLTVVPTYTLTGGAGSNGTVSPASTNVPAGESAAFVITASNYYRIATLKTNDADVTGMSFDNNSTSTNFIWNNVQTSGVLAATFTVQVTTNAPATVPYEWLAQYGLTNYNTDAVADSDFDGLPTWQEYLADTNPTNATSRLAITGFAIVTNQIRLTWIGGSSAWQFVEYRNSLSDTNGWTAVYTNPPPTEVSNTLFDAGAGSATSRFYRIKAWR